MTDVLDDQWYLKRYPDVAAAGYDALTHYTLFGKQEGRFARAPDQHIVAAIKTLQSFGENCELGLFQRHWFQEPFSLFRWASIALPELLLMLQTDFAGVGRPEYTKIVEIDGLFYSHDLRYGMGCHTRPPTRPNQDVLKATCDRLEFLVRAQVDDLRAAQHIFVRHSITRHSKQELQQLVDAMRRYGPTTLLYVEVSEDVEAGTVERVSDGLLVGYLDRLGPRYVDGAAHWQLSPHWLPLCLNAYALFNEGRAATAGRSDVR